MSEELKRFYREFQAWLDAGRPKHPDFRSYVGLCSNLRAWADTNFTHKRYQLLIDEQTALFDEAFGDDHDGTPFDHLGFKYCHENGMYGHKYANPKRLAWIKEHAQ